jgi:uncharacterized membrane protein YfcA
LLSAFDHISFFQISLVAAVAMFASVVGGVAGYGTGALLPLVLVPMIGAEPVVPILAMSALSTNISRSIAFWRYVDRRKALLVVVTAVPTCIVGAFIYTRLTSFGALLAIGTMLCLSVPLRRYMLHINLRLKDRGLVVGAFGYGFFGGGTTGAGVIVLSLLMATGLEGAAVVATDAMLSIAIGVTKLSVFGMSGVVTGQVLAFGLLIAAVSLPGAFLARKFVEALPVHVHTSILDIMVIVGGLTMIVTAFRGA